MRKFSYIIVVAIVLTSLSSVGIKKASAATLLNASASASTSRPSPSANLASNVAAGATSATVIGPGNLSTFLSSDMATFWSSGTVETVQVATTSANRLTLSFAGVTTAAHGAGVGVVTTPITAVHTIAFTTQTAIPVGGKIVITYPKTTAGTDTNQASPSASTYMFNGLTAGNVKGKVGVGTATIGACTITAGSSGTAPSISCPVETAVKSVPIDSAVTRAVAPTLCLSDDGWAVFVSIA